MLGILHSYISVVCTYHCRAVFKKYLGMAVVFVDLCSQKSYYKGTELQFLCIQGTLQAGRVEDHRMMFTRHLHLP